MPRLSVNAQRRTYLCGAVGFVVLAVLSRVTGFDTNVTYVSKLSELALAFACLAAYQSVRGERKADVLIDAVPGAEDPDR
jgi:positive regulator of sigma E activity